MRSDVFLQHAWFLASDAALLTDVLPPATTTNVHVVLVRLVPATSKKRVKSFVKLLFHGVLCCHWPHMLFYFRWRYNTTCLWQREVTTNHQVNLICLNRRSITFRFTQEIKLFSLWWMAAFPVRSAGSSGPRGQTSKSCLHWRGSSEAFTQLQPVVKMNYDNWFILFYWQLRTCSRFSFSESWKFQGAAEETDSFFTFILKFFTPDLFLLQKLHVFRVCVWTVFVCCVCVLLSTYNFWRVL